MLRSNYVSDLTSVSPADLYLWVLRKTLIETLRWCDVLT